MRKLGLILFVILILASGCTSSQKQQDAKNIQSKTFGKYAVFISPAENPADYASEFQLKMKEQSKEMEFVSIQEIKLPSKNGEINVVKKFSDIKPLDYSGLIIMGGASMKQLLVDDMFKYKVDEFVIAKRQVYLFDEASVVSEQLPEVEQSAPVVFTGLQPDMAAASIK